VFDRRRGTTEATSIDISTARQYNFYAASATRIRRNQTFILASISDPARRFFVWRPVVIIDVVRVTAVVVVAQS
jgi:hypothetical protein